MVGFIFEDFPFHQTATTGPPVRRPRVTVQLLRFSPACYVGVGVVAGPDNPTPPEALGDWG